MKYRLHIKALIAIALIVLCVVIAWVISKSHYEFLKSELIRNRTQLNESRAKDLTDSIRKNLNYMRGIPGFFVHAVRVNQALSKFGEKVSASTQPYEARKKHWTNDPSLNDLDRTLAIACANFHVDIIYVVNAASDAIAASNWDKPSSTIGTNFADREYFHLNKSGQHADQYAVGKTSHIPGLFFTTPVFNNGRFLGAVVAKIDVSDLSFLVSQTDAFVTDRNGVVILAHDEREETLMHSLVDAPIHKMSTADKEAIYQRSDFPILRIEPWGGKDFNSLFRFINQEYPHVIASSELTEYGLIIHSDGELPELLQFEHDQRVFFLLLSALGSLISLSIFGGLLYTRSILRSSEMLRQSEQRFKKLESGTFEGIAITSFGRFVDVNEQLLQILGYERNEIVGQPMLNFIAPDDRDRVMEKIENGVNSIIEYAMLHKNGSHVLVEAHGQPLDQDGIPIRITAIRDITERKQMEQRLEEQAHTDPLTGVNNRRYFYELAGHELARSKRFNSPLALMMLDIDLFKKFNDTYGHDLGDAILKQLASHCLSSLREIDIIVRFGGEEFVVLLPGLDSKSAQNVAERLRRELSDISVQTSQGKFVSFTVSIGISSHLESEDHVDDMIKRADNALYAAKHAGRNCVRSA